MSAQKNPIKGSGTARKAKKENTRKTANTSNEAGKTAVAKRKYKDSRKSNNNIYLAIPLFLIIALVPIIVYVKKVVLNDPGNLYWDGKDTQYDIFSYYKMIYLLIFTGAGLLLYLYMKRNNPFESAKKPYYITTGIFALLVLISAITSDYSQVAFFGFLERYEGAFVLIAYSVILFLAMNVLQDEKSIKILFGCLLASATIISILGVFQYFGVNYFDSKIISSLMTPDYLEARGGSIKPNLGGNLVYSTLYNPNYVGSYMAMLIPILTIFIFWFKKLWQRLTVSAILLLCVINLVGSSSRAGILGVGFAFIILLIIFRKNILAHKWIALSAIVVLVSGLSVFNFITHGSVMNRLASMATLEDKANLSGNQQALDKALAGLSDVRMDNKKLQLITDKGTFKMSVENSSLKVTDGNNADISNKIENNNVTFADKRFSNIKLTAQPEQGLLGIYFNDFHLLDVALTKDGLMSPTNRWLNYRNDRTIETFGFKGMETFGSNRGYIWSRSLPLVKDTIFIGNGPDTFAIYFPQYDFLNKLRFYQTGSIFVDKAHNMYLQTALNTGVLSLLALLALFAVYFVSSVKIYFRGNSGSSDYLHVIGAACFVAFCGYAAAALFNDSVVSVAPVFWVLFGLGIGLNVKLSDKKDVIA